MTLYIVENRNNITKRLRDGNVWFIGILCNEAINMTEAIVRYQ
jgi:hypothetical protein